LEELKNADNPEWYELERTFANIAKLNMLETIKNTAIYAVKKSDWKY